MSTPDADPADDDGRPGHHPDWPDGPDDEQRRQRLLALLSSVDTVAAESGNGEDPPAGRRSAADTDRARLGRVCVLSVSEAGVSGAGITVMAGVEAGLGGARDQVCATGSRTRALEDLQLTTGQGPCLDAYASGAPVLVGVLAAATLRWPGYAPEALDGGTAAVFSLPLQVGAVRLGTLDLNRDTAGPLSTAQFSGALALAGLATETLLELGDPDDPGAARPEGDAGWLPGVHAEVHQASGMVSARGGIAVGDALLRIRAYAFAHGEQISVVARRIVDRDLVLDSDDR